MDQQDIIKIAIAGVILFFSFLAWGFFLGASGVTLESLITLKDLDGTIQNLLSFNFLSFLVFFPISYSLIIAFTKIFDKRMLEGISVAAFVLSGIILLLLLSSIQALLIVGLFYLISLIVLIETAFIKFEEIKHLKILRASYGAISQALLLVGIGLFISTMLFVIPAQEQLVEEFENEIFSSFTPEDVQEELADTTAQIIIQTQTQTITQIVSTPSFQTITQKEDSDVQNFVTVINELLLAVQTPEYKQTLVKSISDRQATALDQTDFQEILNKTKEKIPLFSFLEDYFWLFAAITIMSLFFATGKRNIQTHWSSFCNHSN